MRLKELLVTVAKAVYRGFSICYEMITRFLEKLIWVDDKIEKTIKLKNTKSLKGLHGI